MKIDVDGQTYNIRFQHDDRHEWTVAKIDDWIGLADCSPKDQYNKIVGRKVALSRAMESGDFSKEVRTKIWNALRERGMRLF